MRALILAAGRGERMRPLTDTTPKPLLSVGSERLIERHLVRLRRAGVTDVLVNIAWLGESIVQALGDGQDYGVRVAYSHEQPGALETLGGIRQALPWLGSAPFWLVNADVYTDYEFSPQLLPEDPTIAAGLLLVPNPAHKQGGDFGWVDGKVTLLSASSSSYTYSGIGRYRPEVFAGIAPGRAPLGPFLKTLAGAGRLAGHVHTGAWDDVGTPGRLQSLRLRLGVATAD